MAQPRAILDPCLRSCKNSTGADIAAGVFVKLSGAYPGIALPAGATDTIYGVTTAIIKNGKFGDVQIRGVAPVVAAGVTTTLGKLTTDAAGKAVDWTAAGGRSVGGVGLAAAAGANDIIEVELIGPAAFDIS